MAFVVFALSLVLILAGLWSGYMSLDLLPTPIGVLYALAGAVAVSIAVLAFALGVAIRRIDALGALVRRSESLLEAETAPGEAAPPAPTPAGEAPAEEVPAHDASSHEVAAHQVSVHEIATEKVSAHAASPVGPAEAEAEEGAPGEPAEHPINENRSGHLPTLGGVEPAPEPAGPPALVGRYASGGANYMIFSDGSIEAETTEGTFKFASMEDFKRFIAERKESHA